MTPIQSNIRKPRSTSARPGFTFVEILFAVMILGIGFIMIAGIFPVAINQTQLNGDETVGAALARNGVHYLEQIPYSSLVDRSKVPPVDPFLADGVVHPYASTHLPYVAGNLISAEDQRYAWVPFYLRKLDTTVTPPQPSTSAQVIVVACRSRSKPVYEPAVDIANGVLIPKFFDRVSFAKNGAADQPDTITLSGGNGDALAPGMFLIVASDTGSDTNYPGVNATGWVYRLGARVSTNTWELAPGMDLKASGYYPRLADCYVVGQGKDAANNFVGGAPDVAVYSSFIQIK